MENTVIKVKGEKHGWKVIKYFKSLGVDTMSYRGNIAGNYYGVIDGIFGACVDASNCKVIKLPKKKKLIICKKLCTDF